MVHGISAGLLVQRSLRNRLIFAYAEPQGYYLGGDANTSITIKHNAIFTGVNLDNGGFATRGDTWNLSGSLVDGDTSPQIPIEGATVIIEVDGQQITTALTGANGRFSVEIPVEFSSDRGAHTIRVSYEGNDQFIGDDAEVTAYTWADIIVEILGVSDNNIRSNASHPIEITGRILEVGGTGNVVSGASLVLLWEDPLRLLLLSHGIMQLASSQSQWLEGLLCSRSSVRYSSRAR